MQKPIFTILAITTLFFSAAVSHAAPVVWNGPPKVFFKADFADWTLASNQDRITDNVWITRQNRNGIFNIRQESEYNRPQSPIDTEWATGSAADYESLTFTDWLTWNGRNPRNDINLGAVLHLITDDIYIDIEFLAWTGQRNGGGFAYERSTVPLPTSLVLLASGIAGFIGLRCRKKSRTRGDAS